MPRVNQAGPDPIDVHVGARVRALREDRGLNQSDLGRALGLTFQQVQKYEKGTNRISCSKLVGIAGALEVEPAYFFAALDGIQVGAAPDTAQPLPRRLRQALENVPAIRLGLLAEVAEAMAPPG